MALPPALRVRIATYALAKGLSMPAATVALVEMGLRASERAVAAGKVRGAQVTPEAARAAVQARWAKRQP